MTYSNISKLKVGDDVQIRLAECSHGRDRWTKKVFEIVKIEDHRPVDGPVEHNAIAHLSNGTWQFVWNLRQVNLDPPKDNVIPIRK